MNNIPLISLEDTFHLVQLAREAALARGSVAQAEALTPVIDQMRSLIASERNADRPQSASDDETENLLTEPAFQRLIGLNNQLAAGEPGVRPGDRNELIQGFAETGISILDIARRLEMTREEVNLVIESSRKTGINRR
jgi:hypothetical protein